MLLKQLHLRNFRNFPDTQFTFSDLRTLVTGDNGKGKSNLLEATHFLSLGKSGRGARDRDVVRRGQSEFSVRASLARDEESVQLNLQYDRDDGKHVYFDGRSVPRLSSLIGLFTSVLFSPEDVDLVLRFPAQRRRAFDILLCQASSSYLADLQAYRRVVAQRNRLLRESERKDGGGINRSLAAAIEPWDQQVAQIGGQIIAHRLRVLDQIQHYFVDVYTSLSPEGERASLVYRTPVDISDLDQISQTLHDRLLGHRDREALLGYTLSGPHRDNLVILIDNTDAQQYGSQGQLKSILLAWKLAEAQFLQEATGEDPVLLLDDVFSELDDTRSHLLLEILGMYGQVILTSPRELALPTLSRTFARISIQDAKPSYP